MFEALRETVLPLVDYYLQTRYPDIGEFLDYTEEKAMQALSNSQKIVNAVAIKIENSV